MSKIKVTVRTRVRGGRVMSEHMATEAAHARRRRFILLIHGYNVNVKGAEKVYKQFIGNISSLDRTIASDIGVVFWPGDSKLPLIRSVFYPFKIENAITSGEEFAKYLCKRKDPYGNACELVLIGHSLGCRMMLEALLKIDEAHLDLTKLNIKVFLMAAAVPVGYVEDSGRFSDCVSKLKDSSVFHSNSDFVLSTAFRLGQSLVPSDKALYPEAVGALGGPVEGTWTRRFDKSGYGHGSYWGSQEVAKDIAKVLGAAVAPSSKNRKGIYKRMINHRERLPKRPGLDGR